MTNSFQTFWCQAIQAKLQLYGFSWPAITLIGYECTLADFKQQVIDLKLKADFAVLPTNIFLSHSAHLLQPIRYVNHITIATFKRALFLARFNALPTAVTEGGYQKISVNQRLLVSMQLEE